MYLCHFVIDKHVNSWNKLFIVVTFTKTFCGNKKSGHTKKRGSSPGTGNNARRIGILFKSNFCRNFNM